ncbi:MAG TPA: methyltransferase domain-containing protein [Acidimicrobiales bacterium]|nr:methyltransferase domain-containing protein [Acidimicrobiales bacterium]
MAEDGTARRAARIALWGLAGARVAEACVLRRRAATIAPLAPSEGSGAGGAHPARDPAAHAPRIRPVRRQIVGVEVVAARGVTVDAATRAAASGDMAASGARVVDLVPADLPAERALRLLRRLDPARVATDPLYSPGGAHEAVALDPSLAGRMHPPPAPPADRGALARLTTRAQRHAPAAAVLRVAPALRAAPQGPLDRWRELVGLTAFARPLYSLAPALLAARAAHLAVLAAGVALAPGPGLAAVAAWSAQPAVALARRPGRVGLAPPGLWAACAARVPRAARDLARTAAAGWRDHRDQARDAAPAAVPPPPPLAERFEERRRTCPWCGSGDMVGRLDTTDLNQYKPGRFHLDECRACGHIFQNPALSPAGLDYYYQGFYDGPAEELTDYSFAAMGRIYRRRADVVGRFCEPRALLDVGTGHAHFCLVARQRWPAATVDGLDLGNAVDEAARRGWIDTAYRGSFPDLADGLPRSYDVVTMHHYLEHTREPRRELAAAAKVLEPGGHLVVEVPDTASPWARRLGRWWYSWFQPQHQHFVTCENLVEALAGEGLEVVSVERGEANQGGDLYTAVVLGMQALAPSPHAPWLPPPTLGRRLRRLAAIAVGVPAVALAAVPDLVMDARLRSGSAPGPGNAYRIVARRS